MNEGTVATILQHSFSQKKPITISHMKNASTKQKSTSSAADRIGTKKMKTISRNPEGGNDNEDYEGCIYERGKTESRHDQEDDVVGDWYKLKEIF